MIEWASFSCSTTKDLWTKDFIKVQCLVLFPVFLLYEFSSSTCVSFWRCHQCRLFHSLCCVLITIPEDINWRSFYEMGIRSVEMMHSPWSKGNRKGMSAGNCTGAMSPYLAESLVRQTLLNHIRTSAISAQRRRQSNRNSPDRDQTSHRLRGMSASFTCSLSIIGSIQPNDMFKNFPMLRQIITSCFLSLELK